MGNNNNPPGGIRKKRVRKGDQYNNILSWRTFHLLWAQEFSHFNVSIERCDIFILCLIISTMNQKCTPDNNNYYDLGMMSKVSCNTESLIALMMIMMFCERLRKIHQCMMTYCFNVELEELELLKQHHKRSIPINWSRIVFSFKVMDH